MEFAGGSGEGAVKASVTSESWSIDHGHEAGWGAPAVVPSR